MTWRRSLAAITAAAVLAGCATRDSYMETCRLEASDIAGIEACADRRAQESNFQTAAIVFVGAIAIGLIAAIASSTDSGSDDSFYISPCFPMPCPSR